MLEVPNPDLSDGNITLRRWEYSDLGCIKAASEEGSITEGTSVPEHFTMEGGRNFVDRQHSRTTSYEGWSFAISDSATEEAFGGIVLMLRPQVGVAGIGYWLVPDARGKGWTTRAVDLLTAWGLEIAQLSRIEAWVEPGNDASVGVLSRCGFEYEGRLRSFLRFPDRRGDALMFLRVSKSCTDRYHHRKDAAPR